MSENNNKEKQGASKMTNQQKKQEKDQKKAAEEEKNKGVQLTAEEKKAQREAANKLKAEKKAQAAAKKMAKLLDDGDDDKNSDEEEKNEKIDKQQKKEKQTKQKKEKEDTPIIQPKQQQDQQITKNEKEQLAQTKQQKKVEFNLESQQNISELKAEMKPILTKYQKEQILIEMNILTENKDFKNNMEQVKLIQSIAQKQSEKMVEQIMNAINNKNQAPKQRKQSIIEQSSVSMTPSIIFNELKEGSNLILNGLIEDGSSHLLQNLNKYFDNEKNQVLNPTKIINYLYTQQKALLGQESQFNNDIHPSIQDVGIKIISEKLESTNQITVAILIAIQDYIKDFQPSKKNIIFHQELLMIIRDLIVPFFEKCRRFFSGTQYAVEYVRKKIGYLCQDCQSLELLKEQILDAIDSFINERILYAQDTLINNALKILSETREETILVFGNEESQTIENILKKAFDLKTKKFSVIIVDSAPEYKGRNLAKRLSTIGIKCKYTLIQMLNFLIQQVTKVFLSATYILCNGALVAPIGSSMIACLASKNNVPVVAVCETYKFADRVNLDQINNNEQGSQAKVTDNYLRKTCKNKEFLNEIVKTNAKHDGKKIQKVEILNLKYDLTPQKYLSMIVCEIGNIPPHSVPIVIKELKNDQENEMFDKEDIVSDDEETNEFENEDYGPEFNMKEQENEDEDSDLDDLVFKIAESKRDAEKAKRIAENQKNMLKK